MRVAIGGTFDPLHAGHRRLLKKVYELSGGDDIVIGLTSDRMARASRCRTVLSYEARAENIKQYMWKEYGVRVRTVELNDRYGVTLDEDFDYIVISPETYKVAVEINEKRKKRGKKLIRIVKVEHAKAEDGKIISSTRIKEGEIDKYGRVIR